MPVQENESGPWSETQDEPETRENPKIEPWVLFGAAFIVAVGSILFAIGIWVVKSHQTDSALERETVTSELLNTTQLELDLVSTRTNELQQQYTDLQNAEATERQELRTVRAELESIKRERDPFQSTLEDSRRNDTNPSSLQAASLSNAIGSLDNILASVYLSDDNRKAGLTRGSLLENLKQLGRTKCGFGFTESGNMRLVLSVIAANSKQGTTAISVSLSLQHAWKVPGQDMKHHVYVWQSHTVGLSSTERASAFVEELVESLIDDLASELRK